MTVASIGSVLARLPKARAKARTRAGLTTTTGRPAAANEAAASVSYPPVASIPMAFGGQRPEPRGQFAQTGGGPVHGERFSRWADRHIQAVFGNIDTNDDGVHLVPSLHKRASRAALATVRVRWIGGRGSLLWNGLGVPEGAWCP